MTFTHQSIYRLIAAAVLLVSLTTAHAEWIAHPKAIQTVYQNGVPHTDRNGRMLDKFDAKQSFFPLVLYHALHGEHDGVKYDFHNYAAAGFNAAHLWEVMRPTPDVVDAAADAGLQLIVHFPTDEEVRRLANNRSILAWYLDEEPIGTPQGIEERLTQFLARRKAILEMDPTHPIFPLDAGWIKAPTTASWIKWNSAGDVSSHDNYPINQHHQSLSHLQGIPETVSLAVKSNDEKKPFWFCMQAFEANSGYQFSMPSSRQLRCMTYTSIVHGATGIIYFALDSRPTRTGNVVGMSPDPRANYGRDLIATNDQLRMSRELWDAAKEINHEIEQLKPVLLSPTAKVDYQVQLDSELKAVTDEPIRTLLKTDPAGGYMLIVVNVDAAPQGVRVVIPGMKFEAKQFFDAPGAGNFVADGQSFSFMASPWNVQIIRIIPK